MTDMPSFGILCAGKDIKELSLSVRCCSVVSEIMKNGGFSLSGYHTLIACDDSGSRKMCADKMYHLCRVCDVLLTIGCDGFSRDDIVPDVTEKLCEGDLAFFTSNLCGICNIGNYDKGKKRDLSQKFLPTRSRSGILRGRLVLNIRNDEDFIREILPNLLSAISFAISGLSGKDAAESKKLLCEFEMQFSKIRKDIGEDSACAKPCAGGERISQIKSYLKHKK